jgi:hypothetical protein
MPGMALLICSLGRATYTQQFSVAPLLQQSHTAQNLSSCQACEPCVLHSYRTWGKLPLRQLLDLHRG